MAAEHGGRGLQPPEHAPQPSGKEGHGSGGGTVGVPCLHAVVTTQWLEGMAEGPGSGRRRQTPAVAGGGMSGGRGSNAPGDGEGQAGSERPWFGEGSEIIGATDCHRIVPKDVGDIAMWTGTRSRELNVTQLLLHTSFELLCVHTQTHVHTHTHTHTRTHIT